jgi:2-dehydropantoate 2-reductase
MNKIRYAIIGTGGLGGFYGGMLAKAGQEVHFLFHSDYQHVKKYGLKVDSVLGDFHLPEINAYQSTAEMPVCDVVLVCLKTTSNHLLKELLPPLLHRDTCVILVQNGLGIEAALAETFPGLSIAGGLAFICSSKIGDGYITHLDYGKITIGSHQGDDESLLRQVCADFEAAGVSSEFSKNLGLSRWKKLVWNVPYNGMCVVLNTTTEKLMANPETYSLMKDLMLEVIGAANACGYAIGEGFAQAMLDSTAVMKPYAPSMKLDYDFKRPLEIEAIYSAPLKAAQKLGYLMPKVSMLEKQLYFVQNGYIRF